MSTGFYRKSRVVRRSRVVVGADAVVRHTRKSRPDDDRTQRDLVGKLFPSLFTADTQTQVDACIRRRRRLTRMSDNSRGDLRPA